MAIREANLETFQALVTNLKSKYALKTDVADYGISKVETASGYFASYSLTKGGVAVGDTINIPKDYLLRSADVKICTEADNPVTGYVVGDKYIDFAVNTAADDGTVTHLYIKVNDLVSPYSKGNGIDISSSNVVSVKIDTTNANGLDVSADGLKLALATETSAGAMSAADKKTLGTAVQPGDFNVITAEEINALFAD